MKEMKSFRLDFDSRYYLEKFSKEDGISQSAIIEKSIDVLRSLRSMRNLDQSLTCSIGSFLNILGISEKEN